MINIGPSTGWLYAIDIFEILQQEEILQVAGANSVEICLGDWWTYFKRRKVFEEGQEFKKFCYRSLHIPNVYLPIVNDDLVEIKNISDQQEIATVLTHPIKAKGEYPQKSYQFMVKNGVPLAIENMDNLAESGKDIKELENLINEFDLRFVLDVQHAFEWGVEYTRELFSTLKGKLAHLHVSGELLGNRHCLLYKATNASVILKLLDDILKVKLVPLILEGEYTTSFELAREIAFITQELCIKR